MTYTCETGFTFLKTDGTLDAGPRVSMCQDDATWSPPYDKSPGNLFTSIGIPFVPITVLIFFISHIRKQFLIELMDDLHGSVVGIL